MFFAIALTINIAIPVYADNQSQLAEINNNIDNLEEEKNSLLFQIDSFDRQLITIITAIDTTSSQIADKEKEIDQTTADLHDVQVTVDKEYNAMKSRIQYIYEQGGNIDWCTLLISDNLGVLNNVDFTEDIYKYDRQCLADYLDAVQTVADLQKQQQSQKSSLEQMKHQQEQQKTQLEAMKQEAIDSSYDVDKKLSEAQKLAGKYLDLIEKQNMQIAELETVKSEEQVPVQPTVIPQQETVTYQQAQDTPSDTANSTGSDSTGSDIASYACQFVGNPYVWGGTSLTDGCDCSGFVQAVYAHAGINLSRTTYTQANEGTAVSYGDMQPGDVINYGSHTAIYIGNNQIVHAADSDLGIIIQDNPAFEPIVTVRRFVE